MVAALGREVDAASPSARRLLEGAAVVGDPFAFELAASAADACRDATAALDELLRLELVQTTDVPTEFRFRHPIVRAAIYEASGAAWRIVAYARVATGLQRRGASAVERAHHVERSARPGDEEAVTLLQTAAEAAAPRARRAPRVGLRRRFASTVAASRFGALACFSRWPRRCSRQPARRPPAIGVGGARAADTPGDC